MKRVLLTALLACSAFASAAGTPAGTVITNTAYIDTLQSPDPDAPGTAIPSEPVSVTVQQVPNVAVTPNSPGTPTAPTVPTNPNDPAQCGQTVTGIPGQTAVLTYTVTNPSNGTDTYALTTNAITGTDGSAVLYYLDNGDKVFDTTTDTAIKSLTLAADASATVFATFPVPATATGEQGFAFTPVATSATSSAVFDGNNYGCIVAQQVLGITIVTNNQSTAASPSTVTYNHTITNIGNTSLSGTQIEAAQTNDQLPAGWTTTVTLGNGQPYPTLQEAINAFGSIAPGQSVPMTVTLKVPYGQPGGTQNILTWSVRTTPDSTPQLNNTTLAPTTVKDITTILEGQAGVDKTIQSCGTDTTCAAPTLIPTGLVKPDEVVQYTVIGRNSGQGGLRGTRVRDLLPADLVGVSYTAAITGATGGQLIYSADGKSWTTSPVDINGTTSSTVYVAYDSNLDGTLSYDDILPAGAVITIKVTAKVK